MNKNAVSTLISAGIFFLVIYMFKDQLKAVFSGNTLGSSMRGVLVPGARTSAAPAIASFADNSSGGELYNGLGVPGMPSASPLTIGPNGEILLDGSRI